MPNPNIAPDDTNNPPKLGDAYTWFAFRHNLPLRHNQVPLRHNQVEIVEAQPPLERISENQLRNTVTDKVFSINPISIKRYLENLGVLDSYGIWNLTGDSLASFSEFLTLAGSTINVVLEEFDFYAPVVRWHGNFIAFTLVVNPDSLVWTDSVQVHYRKN